MSRMRLVLFGLLVVLAVSEATSASSLGAVHWYVCEKPGGSTWLYSDSLCSKDSAGKTGAWEVRKLPEGRLLEAPSIGGPFTLGSKVHGIKIEIKCEKKVGRSWIENPPSGGNGIGLGVGEFTLCTVPKPGESCMVKEPIIADLETELQLIAGNIWGVVTSRPKGVPFTELEFLGCTGGASVLNGSYKIEGKTAALGNKATSTAEFSEAMDELTFAGEHAKFEGKETGLTDGGGGIQAL